MNMLNGVFSIDEASFTGGFSWLKPIAEFLNDLLVPLTIIVAVAGAIWVIILGVGLARAESADKATEAKKRLINVAVAMLAVIIFIWLLTWFASNVGTIFESKPIEDVPSSIISAFLR